jgi:hypothetical protein
MDRVRIDPTYTLPAFMGGEIAQCLAASTGLILVVTTVLCGLY